jgi:glycosyltransferase involved in cell wall biosynthesis
MQFHLISFEGPDLYSRSGGLATRVCGLADTLVGLGYETHLWFIGDPELPGHEKVAGLHIHRWAQWVSRHHPRGVYDGEIPKSIEMARSLPGFLVEHSLRPSAARGERAVVIAEEWQTAATVMELVQRLRAEHLEPYVTSMWNANNVFGFHEIDWARLADAAVITTVSRYMKHKMRDWGVDSLVIPNGLGSDGYDRPDRRVVGELRSRFRTRTLLTKMARWDPDKRWCETIDMTAEMKRRGWNPLLLARGGNEPHGREVLQRAQECGLRVIEREWNQPGPEGLMKALRDVDAADVVNLTSFVDASARRALFRGSHAVLANSCHEPFGLVGLEAMAAGGIACIGCSGEDYAVPGQNALVLETANPSEFMALFSRIRADPREAQALRRAGQATARRYAWPEVVRRVLLPRVDLAAERAPAAGV